MASLTKLVIRKVTAKPFTGGDGEKVPYFWIKAQREDGVTIEFGTQQDHHTVGETETVNLERVERSNGKIGYKEINAKDL